MKYIVSALLLNLAFCSNNRQEHPVPVSAGEPGQVDSCVLINNTSKRADLLYFDKYGTLIQFYIAPGQTKKMKIDSMLVLTQPNMNQNKYIITRGDSLDININSRNDFVFSDRNDTAENKNLNVSAYINERLSLSFFQINNLLSPEKERDYTKLDSIVSKNYTEQMELLAAYRQKPGCTDLVQRYLAFDFITNLINYKFYIGKLFKKKITGNYSNQLDSLFNALAVINEAPFIKRNGNLNITYFDYKYMTGKLNKSANDSFYAFSNRYLTHRAAEETKFWIVKRELSENTKSKKWFIRDFKETCKNKELVDYIAAIEQHNSIVYNAEGANQLMTPSGTIISYDSLIKTFAGKVIYVDFWASWCAPCRASMPASFALRTKLDKSNVIFLYLSIDDNIQAWKTACSDDKLTGTGSFILLNTRKSGLARALQLNAIPRYIVIGKTGKIVNANAPEPGDSSTFSLLARLAG
jgi:thiol-disulfide isomerase/thioredoxin